MVHDGAEQAALPLQFRLGLLALGDVAHHGMEHRQLVELHGAEGHFRREQAAVAALVGPFEAVQAPGHGDFHHGLGLLRRGLAVGLPGRRQVDGGNAPKLGKVLEAEHLQGRRIGLGEAALADDPGGVGGMFEEGAEAPLALGQGGLDFLALGDFPGQFRIALADEAVAPHQLGDEIEQQQGVGQGHQEQGRVQQIGAGPARLGQARQLPGAARHADVHQHRLLTEYRTVAPDHAAVGAVPVPAAQGQVEGAFPPDAADVEQAIHVGHYGGHAPIAAAAGLVGDEHRPPVDQGAAALDQIHRAGQEGAAQFPGTAHRGELLRPGAVGEAQGPLVAGQGIDLADDVIRCQGDVADVGYGGDGLGGHAGEALGGDAAVVAQQVHDAFGDAEGGHDLAFQPGSHGGQFGGGLGAGLAGAAVHLQLAEEQGQDAAHQQHCRQQGIAARSQQAKGGAERRARLHFRH